VLNIQNFLLSCCCYCLQCTVHTDTYVVMLFDFLLVGILDYLICSWHCYAEYSNFSGWCQVLSL